MKSSWLHPLKRIKQLLPWNRPTWSQRKWLNSLERQLDYYKGQYTVIVNRGTVYRDGFYYSTTAEYPGLPWDTSRNLLTRVIKAEEERSKNEILARNSTGDGTSS